MYHDEMSSGREFTIYEGSLDLLPIPIMIHDHKLVLFANRTALELLGATDSDEIIGKPISAIVHRDAAEAGVTRRQLVLDHGHSVRNVPLKLVGVDGAVLYVTANALPIVQSNGAKAVLVTGTLTRTVTTAGADGEAVAEATLPE